MDTFKNFLFTLIVGCSIIFGLDKLGLFAKLAEMTGGGTYNTYTVEPRLVEMYEHENAYMIWVSDPVSRLFVLDKGGERSGVTSTGLVNGTPISTGTIIWGNGTTVPIPSSELSHKAYIVEDPFLFEGQVNLPTKIVCRPALQGPQRGIAKLLYINAPRFDWVGCAVPAQLIAGTDYKETKPWEVSYIKREGRPDSPRIVMGEKGSKVKWWVQDGTWGRGVQ